MGNQPDSCPSISVDSPARQPDSAHLSDMLDSLSDGFMSIDRSWRFIYLNLTAERYLQQKRENLVGQVIWQCFPELAESGYGRVYLETLATGQPGRHTDYYAPLNTWFEARSFAHDDGITVLFRDVTYNHQHEAQLQFEANHDYLTGLPNRRKCMEVLSRVVAEAACADLTRGAFLAVLLIDLDHFKEVNDAFGHSVGDGLLRDFANRLLGILEPSIFVARVGGDKFILLYSETTESAAEALGHAILTEFATPFDAAGKSISLSASIGIALLREESTLSETLLSHADTAMYAAKASGRHRVRLFDDALDRGMRDRLALRMDLPGAFAAKQFELHFQPQIALYDDSPVGAEALLRWRHPERGLLGPAAFLEVLLDSPYEETLVGWLLNAVCEHIGAWRRLGMRDQRISLNLSPRQLLGVGLLEKILEIANAHNVPLALIGVEVTEESLVSDIEKATSVLAALRQAGISTSLDDFGSGYSSLGYLVRLPIETLKIDRSFVQALVISEKASAVVRGIVGLAKSLGMKTVAEGVENERQLAELRDAGCDVIQGYLISRPLEADSFAQYMLRL